MAKIIIPTPLRKFTANQASFDSTKGNVGDAMLELAESFPSIKQHLFDAEGKLRNFVKVYVGDEDIKALENEATAVQNDTVISIIPAIAGGSF